MALKLMGKKRGMTQLFDENGNAVPCTVIEVQPNIITQIKTKESDGYAAIQLGFDKIIVKDQRTIANRVNKPQIGHFAKANIEPRRHLAESRLDKDDDAKNFSIGQEIGVDQFSEIQFVDVTATTKGKGFQGVMKKYGMRGGPASHGSGFHRHQGSRGMRSTPGRVLPGTPAASHMGDQQKTVQNLRIIKIIGEDNLIILQGQVPGPKNGLVYISKSKKKYAA